MTVRWYAPGKVPEDAYRLRCEVFIQEQGFQKEIDERDQTAWHVVLYEDEMPAATGRINREKEGCHISRICVKKELRKHHLGSQVIRALEEKAKEWGEAVLSVNAQLQAEPFYQRLGFVRAGEEYLEEHCPHVAMRKQLD